MYIVCFWLINVFLHLVNLIIRAVRWTYVMFIKNYLIKYNKNNRHVLLRSLNKLQNNISIISNSLYYDGAPVNKSKPKTVVTCVHNESTIYSKHIWALLKLYRSVSHFALWPLRPGHHNKAIHWLELLCLSLGALLSFSSKVSCSELYAYWDQREMTRVRVTYCSDRALAHPAAAGPRADVPC